MGDLVFEYGLPGLFTLAGLFMCVACLHGLVAKARQQRRAVRTPGLIVDLRPEAYDETSEGISHTRHAYAPVLEFRLPDGRVVQTVSGSASNPPVGQPGQPVRVAYDRDDPTDAWVDTFRGTGYLAFLGGAVVGGGVFAIGLLFLVF